jgi:hypothetical protein
MRLVQTAFTRSTSTSSSHASGQEPVAPTPSVMRSTRLQLLAIFASVALVVLTAGCGASNGLSARLSTDSANQLNSVSALAPVRSFQLLRNRGTAVSAEMEARLREARARVDGVHLLGHMSQTAAGPLWLVADGNLLCLFAGHPLALSCVPLEAAERSGVALGIVENPEAISKRRFTLYGVVPVPVKSVRVRRGNSVVLRVPGRDGVFSMRSREPLVELPISTDRNR